MKWYEKNKDEIYYREEIFISNIIGLLFLSNQVKYFLTLIDIKYLDTFIPGLIFLLIFFIKRRYILKYIKYDTIFLFLFLNISWIISGFFYDNIINWLGVGCILFLNVFPWYIIARSIKNYKLLINRLYRFSYYILFVAIGIYIFKNILGFNRSDDMALSYGVLPAILIGLYFFLDKKDVRQAMVAILGTILVLIGGSRGPLLCIAVFILLYVIINLNSLVSAFKYLFILSILSIAYICIDINQLILNLKCFLMEFGIRSRILDKFLDGTIGSTTGRNYIQEACGELIMNHPFWGVGMGVEREYIYSKVNVYLSIYPSSAYPHNIFYEILVQYGLVLGGLLLGLLLLLLFTGILSRKGINYKIILILFISLGFVHLWISSTYLQSQYFFILIGLLINNISNRKGLVV